MIQGSCSGHHRSVDALSPRPLHHAHDSGRRRCRGALARLTVLGIAVFADLMRWHCAVAGMEVSEVMSVLSPGQGENLTLDMPPLPTPLTSQLAMYKNLPNALNNLSPRELGQFYKPMDFAPVPSGELARVDRPTASVLIVRDKTYAVPRIMGATRKDVMFSVGYAQAQSVLWQMEVNRHTWHARSAELLGRGPDDQNLADDAILFRVLDYSADEYRTMYERLRTGYGRWGAQAYMDIQAYVDGINAYVDIVRAKPQLLPVEFRQRGLLPSHWSPLDIIASTAWCHVRGLLRGLGPRELGNAVLLQRLRARFGSTEADRIYSDLRDEGDPETPSVIPSAQAAVTPARRSSDAALLDLGSFVPRAALI